MLACCSISLLSFGNMLLLPFRHSREGSYFGRDVGLLPHLPHSLSRAHAAFWKSFDLAASLELMLFLHWQPQLLDGYQNLPGCLVLLCMTALRTASA